MKTKVRKFYAPAREPTVSTSILRTCTIPSTRYGIAMSGIIYLCNVAGNVSRKRQTAYRHLTAEELNFTVGTAIRQPLCATD